MSVGYARAGQLLGAAMTSSGSRCVQLEPQNRRVAAEVRVRGVDGRAVARRDGADEEVDGASDDALGATAMEEGRGAFIVVGRDGHVRKRAQRGAQALPGLPIETAREDS